MRLCFLYWVGIGLLHLNNRNMNIINLNIYGICNMAVHICANGGGEFNPKKNKKKFDKRRKGGRNAWLFKFAWYCLIKLVVQQV